MPFGSHGPREQCFLNWDVPTDPAPLSTGTSSNAGPNWLGLGGARDSAWLASSARRWGCLGHGLAGTWSTALAGAARFRLPRQAIVQLIVPKGMARMQISRGSGHG